MKTNDEELLLTLFLQAKRIIERAIIDAGPCACNEAYTIRNMVDPDCSRCNWPDFDEASEWLATYYEKIDG